MNLDKWKSKIVIAERQKPILSKILIGTLIIAVLIMGGLLYLNSDTTSKLENEKEALKAHNVTLQQEYDNLSDSIIHYIEDEKYYEKEIELRNKRIEQLKKGFTQIQKDYDKEINDIHTDSTVSAFRAINDIFRQHDSSNK